MVIDYLANQKKHIPQLAEWYFSEWGYLSEEITYASIIDKLSEYLNTDEIPLILVAIEQDQLVGAAQLKIREMSIYPDKEHWLGGVYVREDYRGQEIAKMIVENIIDTSSTLGVKKLHLQTENLNGGLYSRLGWQPFEKVNYRNVDVLVMDRQI